MTKRMMTILTLLAGLILFFPSIVHADDGGQESTPTSAIEEIDPNGVLNEAAPDVSLEDIEGRIERGGSQIYSLLQTVVIYASYMGFAIGTLWIIFGFGRSGRVGGVIMMLFSSIAFFLIGHGPSIVGWLGSWFNSL